MITVFYTCKRPSPYIGQTLDSYFDLYSEPPFVFEQGPMDSYLNRNRVRTIESLSVGLIPNWLYMVNWLFTHTYDQCYMLCEDDIQFRSRVSLPDITNVGFLSPYCSKVNRKDNTPGWQTPNILSTGLCGALCIILPRQSLEAIVKNEERFKTLTSGMHLDYAIGKFFEAKTNYVHYPTAVLHIGDVSTRSATDDTTDPRYNKIHETRLPAL